jgi:hypothetical protein
MLSRPARTASRTLASLVVVAALTSPAIAKRMPPPSAIPAAIAARLPAGGFLIARITDSGANDYFAINRVDRNGTTELVREAALPDAMTWLDAHTLVTLATTIDSNDTTVRFYVDGVLAPARTVIVKASAWSLPKGKTVADTGLPELWRGKGPALWLARCHTMKETGVVPVCKGSTFMRLDGGPTPAAKAPGARRITTAVPTTYQGGKLPKGIKAPAGFAVKLGKVALVEDDATDKVQGFTCTAPGATATWPQPGVSDWRFDVRPSKVTWLMATPPVFVATGKATSPIGETSTAHRVFRACAPKAMDDFLWLGDGRWAEATIRWQAEQYVGATWTLYVDDVAIATLDGSAAFFAVAPLTP